MSDSNTLRVPGNLYPRLYQIDFSESEITTFFGLPRLRLGASASFVSLVLILRGLPLGLFSICLIFSLILTLRGLPLFRFSPPLAPGLGVFSSGITLILPSETNFNKTFSISLPISRFNLEKSRGGYLIHALKKAI